MELFRTPLGDMKLVEMYLYYDRPYIFLCEDRVGSKYITHLVDEDENGERWFLVPTSNSRVECVRAGKVTLRDSILSAECGWVWDLVTPNGPFSQLRCEKIDEMDLPEEDAVLDFPERHLPLETIDAGKEATQKARNIVLISLNSGNHSQSISVNDYGSVLLRSQQLITTLSLECGGCSKGRIPLTVIEDTSFNYMGNFAASVGIRLEAKKGRLFDPCIELAMERFLNLLKVKANPELLKGLLKELPLRAIARYKFFLEALSRADMSLKVEWGSPHKGRWTEEITKEEVRGTFEFLSLEGEDVAQNIELKGDILGLLVDEKKNRSQFEFRAIDGERYKGRLEKCLMEEIGKQHIEIPRYNICVTLEETIEINPVSGEESVSYVLIKVKDV